MSASAQGALTVLRELLLDWLSTGPRRLERTAASKDANAAPALVRSRTCLSSVQHGRLILEQALDLHAFLRRPPTQKSRKRILQQYRNLVVQPVLLEFDRRHLFSLTVTPINEFGCTLDKMGFFVLRPEWELFQRWAPQDAWLNFRAWCIIRITARWPLPLLGRKELPSRLTCPACGEVNAPVTHLLCACHSSLEAYAALRGALPSCPRRSDVRPFLRTVSARLKLGTTRCLLWDVAFDKLSLRSDGDPSAEQPVASERSAPCCCQHFSHRQQEGT